MTLGLMIVPQEETHSSRETAMLVPEVLIQVLALNARVSHKRNRCILWPNRKTMHGLMTAHQAGTHSSQGTVTPELEALIQELESNARDSPKENQDLSLSKRMMRGLTTVHQAETHSFRETETPVLEDPTQELVLSAKVSPRERLNLLLNKKMMHGLMIAMLREIHLRQVTLRVLVPSVKTPRELIQELELNAKVSLRESPQTEMMHGSMTAKLVETHS
jgi:hypothetical protein